MADGKGKPLLADNADAYGTDGAPTYVLANFGGPRNSAEVYPFLRELLTDPDVIKTPLPRCCHNCLFGSIAWCRSKVKVKEYAAMGFDGGGSPLFGVTERMAAALRAKTGLDILTFHRYNPDTHAAFFKCVNALPAGSRVECITLFPHYSCATVGSIEGIFAKRIDKGIRVRVMRSYHVEPGYIRGMAATVLRRLADIPAENGPVHLIFSAHGLPKKMIDDGDPYKAENEATYAAIMALIRDDHPAAAARIGGSTLCFQSRLGWAEWIKPYTIDVVNGVDPEGDVKDYLFVPIAFTMDHLETLSEIEHDYMSVIREKGLRAHRADAMNLDEEWTDTLARYFLDLADGAGAKGGAPHAVESSHA